MAGPRRVGKGFDINLHGDWKKADQILKNGSRRMKRAVKVALKKEGQFLRREVVRGIRRQAPGGKKFRKVEKTTLAIRRFQGFRGRKALIRAGDLVGSITVLSRGDGVFIGVLKTKRTGDGRSMVNVARIHEFGSRPFVIKITPKMQRFLHMVFAKARLTAPRKAGANSTGMIVTRIPKRPFLKPVFDKHAKPQDIGPRVMDRVAIALGNQFGKPRKSPPK